MEDVNKVGTDTGMEHIVSDEDNNTNLNLSQSSTRSSSVPPSSGGEKRKAKSPLFNVDKRQTPGRKPRATKVDTSFNDKLVKAFCDPVLLNSVSPLITSITDDAIKSVIFSTVDAAIKKLKTSVLDKIIESNGKLHETLETQMNLIREQKASLDEQASKLKEKDELINNLKKSVAETKEELKSIKDATNEIEQYGRRNSLRLINLRADDTLSEPELTNQVIIFINTKVLKDGSFIEASDVERCHPIGRPNRDGHRQILLKFAKYHSKHLVYKARSNLRKNPDRIFISEDLTRANYGIIKSLQPLKKSGKIHSFWTTNGKVLAKLRETSEPIRLKPDSDLESCFGIPKE